MYELDKFPELLYVNNTWVVAHEDPGHCTCETCHEETGRTMVELEHGRDVEPRFASYSWVYPAVVTKVIR